MAEEAINEVIRFLKAQLLASGITVKQVAIFGSQLYLATNEESDLDIIIVSDEFIKKDIFERSRMSGKSSWNTIKKFMIPLDILYMTPKEFADLQSVKRFETRVVA